VKRDNIYLETLRKKRFEKYKKRLRRKQRSRRYTASPRALGRGQLDLLVTFLREHFKGEYKGERDGADHAYVVKIPEVFSFTYNPGPTFNVIRSVIEICRRRDARSLRFDHSKCTRMDLGASTVLDVVVLRLLREWRARGGPFGLGGVFPENERVKNLFQCMGMTKHLKVKGAEAPVEFEQNVVPFELFAGKRTSGSHLRGGSHQELAASKLVRYLNLCFEKAGFRLGIKGQRHVVKWAGEVITNAEEHSGQNEWFAIGYMVPPDPKNVAPSNLVGECQLVIFNFGKSIFQSIIDPNTPAGTRDEISRLAATHSRKKFFFAENFTQADLCTLYALQDGVSRFSQRPGAISRGKGTVQMIQAFQKLGSSAAEPEPNMTLLSGRTRILFNSKYSLVPVAVPGGTRSVIAFNENNDLEDKPDSANVHTVSGTFPGTLLSFKFFVDKGFLEKLSTEPANVVL
jgi:hypothetical protein